MDAADKDFYGTTIFLTNGRWMIHSNELADETDKHSFQAMVRSTRLSENRAMFR